MFTYVFGGRSILETRLPALRQKTERRVHLRLAALLVLVTAAVSASEGAAEPSSGQAVVAEIALIRVPSRERLSRLCGETGGPSYACTRFVGRELNAECGEKTDGSWAIRAAGRYLALMYIVDARFVEHEKLHLGDIQTAVDAYVHNLAELRFDSRSECDAWRLAAVADFATRLDRFAFESNAQRNCLSRVARRRGLKPLASAKAR